MTTSQRAHASRWWRAVVLGVSSSVWDRFLLRLDRLTPVLEPGPRC